MNKTVSAKKVYETPALTKHQRLQKVTLGTVSVSANWLVPGAN